METTTTTKQIKIELDKIYHPDESILKAYRDANAMDLFFPHRPEFINEKRVFLAQEASGEKIKHKIFSIYRRKVRRKEYMILFEILVCHDYFGNKVDHSRKLGMVEVPVIHVRKALNISSINSNDINSAKPENLPAEVDSMEMKYLWPWERIKDQLRTWYDKGVIVEDCNFYLWVDNNKMGLKGVSFDHFLDLSIEDLELIHTHGQKYAGILKSGEPIDIVLEHIRQKVKEEMKLTTAPTSTAQQPQAVVRK
ncbi:MAG TPA: hypothetical protein VH415_01395 [Nitrososphaeraceae archaeon]|jgi:hypothetical protein